MSIRNDLKYNSVAGVVVLFNPNHNIIECINSYIFQVAHLFIIDNSTNPTKSILELAEENNKLEYIFNNENLGIATALNYGAKKAIEKGYSFLLTMDQDSKAPEDLVYSLLEIAESNKNIGIVSPLHSNKYETHLVSNKSNYEFLTTLTSGNLLSLEAYKNVGKFCDDYFIDYVDIEYCIRLHHYKYKVIQLSSIVLEHNEGNISEKKIFHKKFYPTNNAPFRWYYKTRNLFYLRKKYKNIYPYILKEEIKIFFKNFIKVLLFEKSKLLKLKMVLIGIWDYFKGYKGRKF